MGDHLQMPPTISLGPDAYPPSSPKAPSPAASLLDACRAVLRAGGADAAAHADAARLLDNHRMAPALAAMCAAPHGIYPAAFRVCTGNGCSCRTGRGALPLRADWSAQLAPGSDWLRAALDPKAELVVIVLPGEDDEEEAAAAAALLCAAHRCWAEPEDTKRERFCEQAMVVAPHHRQKAALREALRHGDEGEQLGAADGLALDTVETVQGREAELVVVMYGMAREEEVASEAEFVYSQPRLNVALTRARQKAVLLLSEAVVDAGAATASVSPAIDAGVAFLRRVEEFARSQTGARLLRLARSEGGAGGLAERVGAQYM